MTADLVIEVNKYSLFSRGVGGCKEVSNGEKEQEKLYGRSNRVILVAALDITQSDGGAWKFLDLGRSIAHSMAEEVLQAVPLHD